MNVKTVLNSVRKLLKIQDPISKNSSFFCKNKVYKNIEPQISKRFKSPVRLVFQFEIEGDNLNFLPVGYTYYEECRRIL